MLYQLSHFRSINHASHLFGAESQVRTGDTAIFSRVLYRLSYLGPIKTDWLPVGAGKGTTRSRNAARQAPGLDEP